MTINVGIITAENSLKRIQAIDTQMRQKCNITYLPYTTLAQLTDIYMAKAQQFDGLLFSGRYNYLYAVNHIGAVIKPHVTFELTEQDYYKTFTKLFYEHPNLDIRRLLMESPTAEINFSDVFTKGGPRFFNLDISSPNTLPNAYEKVTNQAYTLWKSGEIDYVITRFTNVSNSMKEMGIPFEILTPSPASMLDCVDKLCGLVQSQRLTKTLSVCGVVTLAEENKHHAALLLKILNEFNAANGMQLVIRKNLNFYEIITSNEVLLDITQNYSNCLLRQYLKEKLAGISVFVGWGVGWDMVQAYKNAHSALQAVKVDPQHFAFLINEKNERVGPLAEGRSFVLQTTPTKEIARLSRKLGISALNLQKLMNMYKKQGTNRFSSSDLAYHMNITTRSANRIFKKLVEYNFATVVENSHLTLRGRPSFVYQIDFSQLENVLQKF